MFLLQAFTAIFSIFAGMFWMAAAYGTTVSPPWRTAVKVAAEDLAAHQAKWNGRAALFASLAAIAQSFTFFYEYRAVVFPA